MSIGRKTFLFFAIFEIIVGVTGILDFIGEYVLGSLPHDTFEVVLIYVVLIASIVSLTSGIMALVKKSSNWLWTGACAILALIFIWLYFLYFQRIPYAL
jgi:uncharacterized membrane protein